MIRAALVLIPAITLAAPARGETVSIGFAPPVGRDFVYRLEQHRPVEGKDSLFLAERVIRFDKADGGYSLRVKLRLLDSDAPPSGAEPYRAALSPLIGIEHRFRVDRTGRIVALENVDAVWTRVEAGLRAMMTDASAGSARHRAAANVITLFDGLSPDGRLSLLAGELQPLFLFASTVAMDGPGRGLRSSAGSPLGKPVAVEGAVTLVGRDGDLLKIEERLAGEGAGVAVDYGVSATSGLVLQQSRTLVMADRTLVEKRSLEPALD